MVNWVEPAVHWSLGVGVSYGLTTSARRRGRHPAPPRGPGAAGGCGVGAAAGAVRPAPGAEDHRRRPRGNLGGLATPRRGLRAHLRPGDAGRRAAVGPGRLGGLPRLHARRLALGWRPQHHGRLVLPHRHGSASASAGTSSGPSVSRSRPSASSPDRRSAERARPTRPPGSTGLRGASTTSSRDRAWGWRSGSASSSCSSTARPSPGPRNRSGRTRSSASRWVSASSRSLPGPGRG